MSQLAENVSATRKRWFCLCVTKDGDNIVLVARAYTAKEASQNIHRAEHGYSIDYIEDILTPTQMEMRKTHLRRDYYASAPLA